MKTNHPAILFNASPVSKVGQHKYLGIILDSRLSCSSHIQKTISKARKANGVLKFMSKYLHGNTLNYLCKLYIRIHLDYGDVIYHILQKAGGSENYTMSRLESAQYSTDLAVSGT